MKLIGQFIFYLIKVLFEAIALGIVLAYILVEVLELA